MSFRTAYNSLKNKSYNKRQGLIPDPTPEEWKKVMDEYYKRQMNNPKPKSWGRWG